MPERTTIDHLEVDAAKRERMAQTTMAEHFRKENAPLMLGQKSDPPRLVKLEIYEGRT